MVGSAVDTIVWSSEASSITSISAPKIGPMRVAVPAGAVSAVALTVEYRAKRWRHIGSTLDVIMVHLLPS